MRPMILSSKTCRRQIFRRTGSNEPISHVRLEIGGFKRGCPLLRVPSAVVPETFNVLVNPGHEHAGQVGAVHVSEHAIDPRLLK